MEKLLTTTEFERMTKEYDKVKYKCSKCGHKVVIPVWCDKNICDWCGKYVFKDKKEEFKYRMKERMVNK